MSSDEPQRRVTRPVTLNLQKEENGTFLPLRVGTRMVNFLVDTGAFWTLMSTVLVEKCGLLDAVTTLHDVTVGVIEVEAECEGGYKVRFVAAIMEHLGSPLLGMNFLLRYGCLLVLDPKVPLMTVRPSRQVQLGLMCGVYKKCTLFNQVVTAILDTGSTHSFIGRALAREFKLRRKFCMPKFVMLFDGSIAVMCRKAYKVEINIDCVQYSTDLIIHPSWNVPLILGMNILSESSLCLLEEEITLSTTNSCYITGEQHPKPSSITLSPPQFYILSNSSRLVTGTGTGTGTGTTRKRRGFPPFKRWFRTSKLSTWLRRGSENEAGKSSKKDEGSESEDKVESDDGKMTTVSESEEGGGSKNE